MLWGIVTLASRCFGETLSRLRAIMASRYPLSILESKNRSYKEPCCKHYAEIFLKNYWQPGLGKYLHVPVVHLSRWEEQINIHTVPILKECWTLLRQKGPKCPLGILCLPDYTAEVC